MMLNRKWMISLASMTVTAAGVMFAGNAVAGRFIAGSELKFDPFNPVRDSTLTASPTDAPTGAPSTFSAGTAVAGIATTPTPGGTRVDNAPSGPASSIGSPVLTGTSPTSGRSPFRDPFRPPTRSPYVP